MNLFSSKKSEHAVNLAGIDSVFIENALCWFTMELLEGENLGLIVQKSAINDLECIKVARSVLAALKVMHAEGVIHRDIKPTNIMVCNSNLDQGSTYKLIDFGTALGIDDIKAKKTMMTMTTKAQMGLGTPAYMSPDIMYILS